MVSKQWLKDYALRIYKKTPGYSFEKVLRLFPKYYASIKFYYQVLEAEKQKENVTKAIATTQFVNDSIALLQKFKIIGENMIKFHANRKEAKTLLDMKKITLDDINFDKKLLDEYDISIEENKIDVGKKVNEVNNTTEINKEVSWNKSRVFPISRGIIKSFNNLPDGYKYEQDLFDGYVLCASYDAFDYKNAEAAQFISDMMMFDEAGDNDINNKSFFPKKVMVNQFRIMDAQLNKLRGSVEAYTRINQNAESADINRVISFVSSVLVFDETLINYMRMECRVDKYDIKNNKEDENVYNELQKPVIDDPEKIAKREFERLKKVEKVESVDRPRRRRMW